MLFKREIVVDNFQLKFFQLAVVASEIGEHCRMIADTAEQFQTRQLVDDLTECTIAVQVGQRVKIEGVVAGKSSKLANWPTNVSMYTSGTQNTSSSDSLTNSRQQRNLVIMPLSTLSLTIHVNQ